MALINPCFKDQNWSHLGEETMERKEKREGEEEEGEEIKPSKTKVWNYLDF